MNRWNRPGFKKYVAENHGIDAYSKLLTGWKEENQQYKAEMKKFSLFSSMDDVDITKLLDDSNFTFTTEEEGLLAFEDRFLFDDDNPAKEKSFVKFHQCVKSHKATNPVALDSLNSNTIETLLDTTDGRTVLDNTKNLQNATMDDIEYFPQVDLEDDFVFSSFLLCWLSMAYYCKVFINIYKLFQVIHCLIYLQLMNEDWYNIMLSCSPLHCLAEGKATWEGRF